MSKEDSAQAQEGGRILEGNHGLEPDEVQVHGGEHEDGLKAGLHLVRGQAHEGGEGFDYGRVRGLYQGYVRGVIPIRAGTFCFPIATALSYSATNCPALQSG